MSTRAARIWLTTKNPVTRHVCREIVLTKLRVYWLWLAFKAYQRQVAHMRNALRGERQ